MNFENRISPPCLEVIKVIGHGSFGYVYEAWDQKNKRKIALKRVEKKEEAISREFEVLNELKDSNHIIKLLDIFYTRGKDNQLVQNMLFEFLDKDLEKMIQNREINSERSIKFFTYQILKGLECCHDVGIAHRDLKPENILVSKNDMLKICDFGSAKFLNEEGKNTPYVVSRYYRAPELILANTNYTTAIDIWSVGCIIAEMVLGSVYFHGAQTEGAQLFKIFDKIGSFNEAEHKYYKKLAFKNLNKANLVENIFERLPKKEITFEKIRKDFEVNNPEFEDLDNLID